jgi:ATP-dependent Clp protease ATP-binding subunit ClpC
VLPIEQEPVVNGYNFTERVRKVLAMAREEAVRLRHEYVGTEHILLGLIREGEGVAATVLQNLSVEQVELRLKVEGIVKKGKATQATGPDLPYTARAKKVLELAMSTAHELGHSYVGTEHLLLGLLREEKGIAAQVLTDAGLREAAARDEVLRILGTDVGPRPQLLAFARSAESSPVEPSSLVSVVVEMRYEGGWHRRLQFPNVAAATAFLAQHR